MIVAPDDGLDRVVVPEGDRGAGNVLTISGTKQQTAEERTERVHRYERTYGAFERTFTLPATVDADKIRASYDHGVLTVTLPKVEKAKPRQIQVELQKS